MAMFTCSINDTLKIPDNTMG